MYAAGSESNIHRVFIAVLAIVLSLPAFPLVGAQSSDPDFKYSDAPGDASPIYYFPGAGNVPVGKSVDLREFALTSEDVYGIDLRIKVEDLQGDDPTVFAREASYTLRFSLETNASYRAEWKLMFPSTAAPSSGLQPLPIKFHVNAPDASGTDQVASLFVDWGADAFKIHLSKDALRARAPVRTDTTPADVPMRVGSQLRSWDLQADRYATYFGRFADSWMTSDAYLITTLTPNAGVRLTRGAPPGEVKANETDVPANETVEPLLSPLVAVEPGVSTAVPIVVQNRYASKRFIQLSLELLSGDASKWPAEVATTVEIPGGDQRVVTLLINATSDVAHREAAMLRVLGTSLGRADEVAVLDLSLGATAPPSPERRTLHFHAGTYDASSNMPCMPFAACMERQVWMNTLATDPLGTLDEGMDSNTASFSGSTFSNDYVRFDVALDGPLVRDIVLDAAQPITGVLTFEASQSFTGDLMINLQAGSKTIGSKSLTGVMIGDGPVAFTLRPLATEGNVTRISTDPGTMKLHVEGYGNTLDPASTVNLDLKFIPRESSLTLPIIADPGAPFARGPLAVSFLALTALTETNEFVYPGRTRLLNLTLLNEGEHTVRAQLSMESVPAEKDTSLVGWTIRLRPGLLFDLKPGESVRIGLSVTPGENAKESDAAWIKVNASTPDDARPHSQLDYVIVSTTSANHPDESTHYRSSAEDESKLADSGAAGTPALGPLFALAAVASCAVLARRTRNGLSRP